MDNLSISNSSAYEAKRFAAKLALFLVLVVATDRLTGEALAHLHNGTSEGTFGGQIHYALEQRNDIVVFGSSRAVHHYVPDVIEPIIGHSVFNAGANAQSILYHYALQQMLLDEYKPKAIILDMNVMDIDPDSAAISASRLGVLRPFRAHASVARMLDEVSLSERLRPVSKSYAYNSMLLQLMKFTRDPHADGIHRTRGYIPLTGSTLAREVRAQNPNVNERPTGTERPLADLGYVRKFVEDAHKEGVPVIVVYGPLWDRDGFGHDQRQRHLLGTYRALLAELNVSSVEISQHTHALFLDTEKFSDHLHLNNDGARAFSELLAVQLRVLLARENRRQTMRYSNKTPHAAKPP